MTSACLGNVEVLPEINSSSFLENWEVKQKAAQKMLKDAKIEEGVEGASGVISSKQAAN